MTAAELDRLFTYHPPTPETQPHHAAIRNAETRCTMVVLEQLLDGSPGDRPSFDTINQACHAFAEVIDAHAPDSADKSAALRCVRLARMAANEAVQHFGKRPTPTWAPFDLGQLLLGEVKLELMRARWQACAAVACAPAEAWL
jgi:hypothetical protein